MRWRRHNDAAGIVALALLLIALSGCASVPSGGPDPDPLEGVNRPVYGLNDGIDRVALKPVAGVYTRYVPQGMRTSVSNFYDNITYPNVVLNDLLQGKFKQGAADLLRFAVNSTFGIGGLFDVAQYMGLDKHEEDFGQTLGVWGVGQGAYVVYPLFGPNTLRDTPGLVVGAVTNVLFYVSNPAVTIPLSVLGVVDLRARSESAIRFRNETALDPYVFTREAYLQRRIYLIYDGDPPLPAYLEDMDEQAGP